MLSKAKQYIFVLNRLFCRTTHFQHSLLRTKMYCLAFDAMASFPAFLRKEPPAPSTASAVAARVRDCTTAIPDQQLVQQLLRLAVGGACDLAISPRPALLVFFRRIFITTLVDFPDLLGRDAHVLARLVCLSIESHSYPYIDGLYAYALTLETMLPLATEAAYALLYEIAARPHEFRQFVLQVLE